MDCKNQILPDCFNFVNKSSTDSTLTPDSRCGGSSTDKISILGLTSIPKSEGFFLSIVFFFAFYQKVSKKIILKMRYK